MDLVSPTEMLINLLKIMKFDTCEYSMKLPKTIFKTPNKELFRKIVCFLVIGIPGFETFVESYSRWSTLPPKLEMVFRKSFNEQVVAVVNNLLPDVKIKPINQSYLIAPHGKNIIEFLISFCRLRLLYQGYMKGILFDETKEEDYTDIDLQIETCQQQIIEARFKFENTRSKLLNVFQEFKQFCHYTTFEEAERAFNRFESELTGKLETFENFISEYQAVEKKSTDLYKDLELYFKTPTIIDGFSVLDKLGIKINIPATINNVDIIKDGKLDLISLFKASKVLFLKPGLHSKIDQAIEELNKMINFLDRSECRVTNELSKCMSLNEKYIDVANKAVDDSIRCMYSSNDPVSVKAVEYLELRKACLTMKELTVTPYKVSLPVESDKLVDWLIKCKEPKSTQHLSVSKSKNSSLIIRLSAKKMNLRKLTFKNDRKSTLLDLSKMFDVCDNRRATLASPSAQRERLKIKHIDDKRKPLRPVVALFEPKESKKGFVSSSPLNRSAAKVLSFGEDSKDGTTLRSLSSIKLMMDDGQSVHSNSYSTVANDSSLDSPLNMKAELKKWDKSTSDSSWNETPDASPAKLNDSVNDIISEFKSLKDQLNLS